MKDQTSAPLEIVAGIVCRKGRVLISRRPEGTHLAGYWELPGGKRRPGESDHDTLRREMLEEVGARVIPGVLFYQTRHRFPDREVRLRFYLADLAPDERPRPLEVAELRWVDAEDLARYRFPPANDALMPLIARHLEGYEKESPK